MAVATSQYSGFSASDGVGTVAMGLIYDTRSLAVVGVTEVNTTASAAAAVVDDNGTIHTFIVAAGTPQTTIDISGLGYVMTQQTVLHHGVNVVITSLPAGVSVTYRFPA